MPLKPLVGSSASPAGVPKKRFPQERTAPGRKPPAFYPAIPPIPKFPKVPASPGTAGSFSRSLFFNTRFFKEEFFMHTRKRLFQSFGVRIPSTIVALTATAFAFACADSALAAGGVSSGGTAIVSTFETILTYMKAAAGTVATIACLWAGYQVLFGHRTMDTMAPVFIGSAILAGAPWIIGLIFN